MKKINEKEKKKKNLIFKKIDRLNLTGWSWQTVPVVRNAAPSVPAGWILAVANALSVDAASLVVAALSKAAEVSGGVRVYGDTPIVLWGLCPPPPEVCRLKALNAFWGPEKR